MICARARSDKLLAHLPLQHRSKSGQIMFMFVFHLVKEPQTPARIPTMLLQQQEKGRKIVKASSVSQASERKSLGRLGSPAPGAHAIQLKASQDETRLITNGRCVSSVKCRK